MFRFRNYRFISFYSNINNLKSFSVKNKFKQNFSTSSVNTYSSHSETIDVLKPVNHYRSLGDVTERRLQILKRNLGAGDHDILSESIIKCGSVDHLLELISLHVNVMNNRHLAEVFETIHDIIKASDDYRRDCLQVLSSQQFKQLCNQTVKRMRFFQTSDILTTLKTLVFLEVSPNTTIIQSLLQMTRQLINDFTLNDIVFLDFLLSKRLVDRREESEDNYMTETIDEERQRPPILPLVEALRLAFPLVIQLKIENKELNFDDIDLVVKCLRLGARYHLKAEVFNQLLYALSIKVPELSISQTYSAIASLLSQVQPNADIKTGFMDRVLNDCMCKVTAPGVSIPDNLPLHLVVSLITNNRIRRDYYHKGLYDMVSDLIIQNPNKVQNSKACAVLWSLTKHSHIHYGLMNFIADKIAIEEPDLILNPKTSFTNILTAFALPANYKPNEPNSESIYKTILKTNHINICKQKTRHLLFKVLKSLTLLNYCPKEETIEWFDRYFADALSASTLIGFRIAFLENIRIIYQGLSVGPHQTDSGFDHLKQQLKPFVDELNAFEIKDLEEFSKSITLETALAQGLGGNQYITSNIFSDLGHLIDYVIVMRKGGYPVPIPVLDSRLTHVNQLDVPSDSKIIAIIGLTFKDFCREPAIKTAESEFKLKSLRSCGITPITINLKGWEDLAEVEKIPYIMREIQENADLGEKQSNVY